MGEHQIQPQMTPNTKTPNPEPYYNYKPLQKGHIRLLRIEPVSFEDGFSVTAFEQNIHLIIKEYSLQSCPPYVALSYTWGNPTMVTDPIASIFTLEPRCYPIHCEERLLRGTRNLRDALRRLRQRPQIHASPAYKPTEVEKDGWGDVDLYWIDAICIDQDDLQERSEQVQYMSKIYGCARSCVVYLGEQDDYSIQGLEVLHKLWEGDSIKRYERSRERTKMRDMFIQRMKSLSNDQRNALSVLLARRYFQRIWCLQEVILARRVVGMLGPLVFNFMELFRIGALMSIIKTDPTVLGLESVVIGDQHFSGHDKNRPRPLDAASRLCNIATIKMRLQKGEPTTLYDTMSLAFGCDTTDERDRIYAMLGVIAELGRKDELIMPVDYHLPVSEVYANATALLSLQKDDLSLLCAVGEQEDKKIESLPSWCPDYSAPRGTLCGDQDRERWHIGSFWRAPPNLSFQDNRLLVIDGFCYDTLAGTATTGRTRSFRHCAKPSELMKLVLNLQRGSSQTLRKRNTPTSRVETLWRLLIMDNFAQRSPAPSVTALFLPNLIIDMFVSHFDWRQYGGSNGPPPNKSPVFAELDALERVIDEICRLEPESGPFLPEISGFRNSIAELHPYSVFMDSVFNRAADAGITSEVDDLLSSTPRDLNSLAIFLQREVYTKTRCRYLQSFFSTAHTGQLGIGYSSIKIGDQVWLLNGHSEPVILRQLPNGNHRFLGQTYIQGMMRGELAEMFKAMDLAIKRVWIE